MGCGTKLLVVMLYCNLRQCPCAQVYNCSPLTFQAECAPTLTCSAWLADNSQCTARSRALLSPLADVVTSNQENAWVVHHEGFQRLSGIPGNTCMQQASTATQD